MRPGSASGASPRAGQERVIAGRYRLLRPLGSGALGETWLAESVPKVGTPLALKLLRGDRVPALTAPLAAALKAAPHPNLAAPLEVGVDGETHERFIVQPWLGGAAWDAAAQLVDTAALAALVAQVCRGLGHLHESGLAHGRLHPRNCRVLRGETGGSPTVVLLDYALAAAGEDGGQLDFRDFGWMLLRALADDPRLPEENEIQDTLLDRIVTDRIQSRSGAIAYVIRRCLGLGRQQPFGSAIEIIDELNRRAGLTLSMRAPELRRKLLFEARLVGREREMERLKMRLEALTGGSLGIPLSPCAILAGESGVGKSRLLREFLHHAGKREVRILAGACREAVRHPYAGFEEVIQALARALQGEGAAEGRSVDALHPLVQKHGGEIVKVAPALARSLGLHPSEPLEPESERMRLADQVSYFIRDAAGRAPILIAVEDVHWADEGTLEILRYLSRVARGGSVQILATARREELPGSPLRALIDEGSGDGWLEQISVDPLSEEQMLELAQASFPLSSREEKEPLAKICREAGGNPYQLQEILCHLAEERILERAGLGWTIRSEALEQVPIPARISQAFLERIDRLGAEEVQILRLIAAFGEPLSADSVSSLLERPRWQVQRQIESLVDRASLEASAGAGEIQFSFRHARQAETLYAAIPVPERRALHERLVAAMRAAAADDPPTQARLVRHLLAAGRGSEALTIGPGVAKALLSQGLAKEALSLAAVLQEAASAGSVEKRTLLHLIGECHLFQGDLAGAERTYRSLEDLSRRCGDSDGLAQALSAMTYVGLWSGSEEERGRRLAGAREAYNLLLKSKDKELMIRHLISWAGHYLTQRRLHIAERLLTTADREARSVGSPQEPVVAWNRLILSSLRGRAKNAAHEAEALLRVATSGTDQTQHMLFLLTLLSIHNERGDYRAAQSVIGSEGVDTRRLSATLFAHLEISRARTLAGGGNFGAALATIDRAIEERGTHGQRSVVESSWVLRARILASLGAFEAAEQILKGSRLVAGMDEIEVEQTRAEVEWRRGELPAASRRMAELYALGRETGNRRCQAAALIAALRCECEAMGGMSRADMARELREISMDGESYEEAMAAGYFCAQEELLAGRIAEAASLFRQTVSEAEKRDAGAWVLRAGTDLWRILEDGGEEAERKDLERKLVALSEEALAGFEDPLLRKMFERSDWCEVYRAVINRPHSSQAPPAPPAREPHPLPEEAGAGGAPLDPAIVGRGSAVKRLLAEVQVAARGDVGVLIQGESGTGKELVARRIHDLSSRKGKPFVAVDCGAVPESLIESELFGYRRGAFTGAERDKIGILEAAEGGTVFLDEIGNAGFNFQSKLLRVLQEREIRRVGETGMRRLNVRVLSATNVDLREEVARGRFREDLYYRLGVLTVTVPPLRDRREDISSLAGVFLEEIRQAGQQVGPLSSETLAALCAHPWPGNVRELKNALQAAALAAGGGPVRPSHLPATLGASRQRQALHAPDAAEKARLLEALRQANGDKTRACRILSWSRMKLYRRMKAHGIPLDFTESLTRL